MKKQIFDEAKPRLHESTGKCPINGLHWVVSKRPSAMKNRMKDKN